MAHVSSFIQKICVVVMAALLVVTSLVFAGCTLDRSVIGCASGETGDDTGRCVAIATPDGGTDAFVAMMDAEVDAGTDAGSDGDAGEMPDARVEPDAGPGDGGPGDSGPPPMDGGADAGRDSGPPDAGTDACVPAAEICGDGIDQDCSGADRPCPLVIRMDGAVPMTGIVIRLVWNEPPPRGRQERGWFFDACAGGIRRVDPDTIECGFEHPDLASGRQLDWFPYDTAGMASRCTRSSCPGTYTVTYLGMPAVPIVTVADGFDANANGIIDAADRAILHVEGLP